MRKLAVLYLLVLSLTGALSAQETTIPILSSVSPAAAVTTPGSTILISGNGFSLGAVVYVGGLEARTTKFLSLSELQVVTPYLRPGTYRIQLREAGTVIRSKITFTALPSEVDSNIDNAIALAAKGQVPAAVGILNGIATSSSDYQVRAFANYQLSKIYFAQGDLWRWAGAAAGIFLNADKSGMAIQTSWRYRLASAKSDYLLPTSSTMQSDLKGANFVVAYDVTGDPEPRFFRGLVNARYGNLARAKVDTDYILKVDPNNSSYRALAAYIAVLSGDNSLLQSMIPDVPTIRDPRALSLLGQAAYINGDVANAQNWWILAGEIDPLQAKLAYLAGKKHLAFGKRRIAQALLKQCTIIAPSSKEGLDATKLLAKF